MEFYWYLRLHVTTICRGFHIIRPFTFWYIHTRYYKPDMLVYKHKKAIEYVDKSLIFKENMNFTGK